jgi:hypothetical protein
MRHFALEAMRLLSAFGAKAKLEADDLFVVVESCVCSRRKFLRISQSEASNTSKDRSTRIWKVVCSYEIVLSRALEAKSLKVTYVLVLGPSELSQSLCIGYRVQRRLTGSPKPWDEWHVGWKRRERTMTYYGIPDEKGRSKATTAFPALEE